MILKKKSLVVALVSGFVISLVMIMTLVGYVMYLELKSEDLRRTYHHLIQRASVRTYSKFIIVTNLYSQIEKAGPLKGSPVLEGIIKNFGNRDLSDMLLKVRFLDTNGASIYEIVFKPQEPSLGASGSDQVNIPYFSIRETTIIKPYGALPFKKVLINCPAGIMTELKRQALLRTNTAKTPNKFDYEVLSLEFSDRN